MTQRKGKWLVCAICECGFYVRRSRVGKAKYCSYRHKLTMHGFTYKKC